MNLIAHAHSILASLAPSHQYISLSSPSAIAGGDNPESLREELSIEELSPIVTKLCVAGKGYPETGGDGALVVSITNALCWNARAALYTLYTESRSSIAYAGSTRRSSSTRKRRWR